MIRVNIYKGPVWWGSLWVIAGISIMGLGVQRPRLLYVPLWSRANHGTFQTSVDSVVKRGEVLSCPDIHTSPPCPHFTDHKTEAYTAEWASCVPPSLCGELVAPTGLHFLVWFSLIGCDLCATPGPSWLRPPASLSHLLATRPGPGRPWQLPAEDHTACQWLWGALCTHTVSAALDFIEQEEHFPEISGLPVVAASISFFFGCATWHVGS